MPVGSYLYVKEHRSMFAEHSFRFYREIKKIRNVRLISPFADTFELIRHAQGVVTLGSTMGFEALMMGTPVLLLGEPWYRAFPGLRRIDTPYQLAYFMQHLEEIERLSRDEAIKLAYAIFDISFDAVKIPRPGTLSDENVESFVAALFKYLPQTVPSPARTSLTQ
jgi:capsule polysaccharide export protein KpsC/LpsZ